MFKLYLDTPELFTCNYPSSEYSETYKIIESRAEKEQLLKKFFGVLGKGGKMVEKGVVNWKKSRLHFLNVRRMEQAFCEKILWIKSHLI